MSGHIDHGKTTLLSKLSGRWTDTHSEELKRGITIKLGYADTILYKGPEGFNRENKGPAVRYVSFIDAPGHEMLMATMLSGAAIVDAAILVVAANEGIKPQTREHLTALEAKKIKHVIILQNKIDLVTKEQALKNYHDIKALIKGTVAENAVIIPVSAQQEVNLDRVFEAICSIPIPARDSKAEPLFIVARSFDINRPGTNPEKMHGAVLGGTLKRGTLKVGDSIEIKPGIMIKEANQIHYKTLKTKIAKMFKGSYEIEEMVPGGSMSIETELDMALGKTDILAGGVASHTGKLPEIAFTTKAKFTLFNEMFGTVQKTKVDPLKVSETLMISHNTGTSIGLVKRMNGNEIELTLKIPLVAFKGDHLAFSRNINNHWRLIGHGEII